MQNYIELYRNSLEHKIHLVFSFASPLVNTLSSGKSFVLPQLDFEKEFEQIESALKESRTDLKYRKVVSSLENLSDILIKNPLVLHFSGHGVKNDKDHLGTESIIYQGEGDMLLFEDNKCWGVFRSEKNISKILEKCKTDIKVVVMLSCHSERVGKIFFNAGIKHVVCIRETEKIADQACIIFANAFYK